MKNEKLKDRADRPDESDHDLVVFAGTAKHCRFSEVGSREEE